MFRLMPVMALILVLLPVVPGTAEGAAVRRVTLTLRDFSYTPDKITLEAGVPAEITIVNKGKVKHEFMVYDVPKQMGSMTMGHDWVAQTNYFRNHEVRVVGGEVNRKGGAVLEVEVGPGKSAVVQFTPAKKGTFEFACQITGHYEAGQKGTLVVR